MCCVVLSVRSIKHIKISRDAFTRSRVHETYLAKKNMGSSLMNHSWYQYIYIYTLIYIYIDSPILDGPTVHLVWQLTPLFAGHRGRLCCLIFIRYDDDMGVSKNNGIPKSSIFIGFSIVKPSILGAHPYFWKHPILYISSFERNMPP